MEGRRVKRLWGTCCRFQDSCCPPLARQWTRQRRQRSSQRPSGPTLRQLPPPLWSGPPTSMCCWGGGCGAAASGQLRGPLPGAGEGSRSLQAAARGEDRGGEQRPAEAPEQGKRHLRPLSLHAGGGPPGEDQDLLHDFRRSLGSYVAGTRNPRNNIVITLMCKSAKDFSLRNPPKELIKLIIRYKDRNITAGNKNPVHVRKLWTPCTANFHCTKMEKPAL